MRKVLVAFLLVTFTIPASAFEFIRPSSGFLYDPPIRIFPVTKNLLDFRTMCPSAMLCSVYTRSGFIRENWMAVNFLTGDYAGIPFDNGAVFCRMENHFLATYNVKFSIHAGGYTE